MTFADILVECEKLKLDDLNTLLEILNNRAREKRRRQMARNCDRAMKNYKAGKCFEGVDALMKAVEDAGD
jgi:hypothetical protein